MRFEVLGPLRVHGAAGEVTISSGRDRTLLAMLLLHANRTVPIERLAEAIWADQPPSGVRNQLQGCVSRLRKRLATTGLVIVTEPTGYRATVEPDDLDLLEFRRLVGQARTAAAGRDHVNAAANYRAALELWRGPALGGADSGQAHAAAALDEEHVQVQEECIEAELAAGTAGQLVPELTELVGQHPHRERLHCALMLALYRADRQADALAAYRHARSTLHDELGIEPGAELQRLHQAILNRDPDLDSPPSPAATSPAASDPPAVPRELPADVTGFTGRTDALKALDQLLDAGRPGGPPGPVVISAIAGTAGVGKTALAVHWAHRVADRFPDGQLYLNLRGYATTTPVRPIEALSALLRSLGTPPEQIPTDEAQAAALYRTRLADRKTLIVLDNARSVDQIRPLLPGSPSCLVLVTSRDRLTGLVARDGATRLTLDVLTPEEARTLLSTLLGHERAAAEPDAIAGLAQACAHLPLALRIAAAHLVDRPHHPVTAYGERLTAGGSLAVLQTEGDEETAVGATLDLSYRTMPPEIQRTFRLLGLIPGPDFASLSVAALTGTSAGEVAQHLRLLAGAHLIEEIAPSRYTFHDLLRTFAREIAIAIDTSYRRTALQQLFDFYLHTADAALALAYPASVRAPLPSTSNHAAVVALDETSTALAWLADERSNLVAAIVFASERGPQSFAWLLTCGLRAFFVRRGHITDLSTATDAAMAAARASSDPLGLAAAHLSLADLYRLTDRRRDAITSYASAASLAEQAEWPDGHAAALGNLGTAYMELGQLTSAAAAYSQSLALNRRTGRIGGAAINSGNLGLVYCEQGELHKAVRQLEYSLELYQELGHSSTATCLLNLAYTHHQLGNLAEAQRYATRSLELHDQLGDGPRVSSVAGLLAEIHGDAGRLKAAIEYARISVKKAQDAENPRSTAIALNNLGNVHMRCGDPRLAIHQHKGALKKARAVGYRISEIDALLGLAVAQHCLGNLASAYESAERCRSLSSEAGYRVFEGRAMTCLAGILLSQGRHTEAGQAARDALDNHRATGHRLGMARTLALLGRLSFAADMAEEASRYWKATHALLVRIGAPPDHLISTEAAASELFSAGGEC